MKGYIRQRGQSFLLTIELDRDPITKKRRQQYVTVHGKKGDAEKKLRDILHQRDTGNFVEPNKLTVSEYLTRWLADYAKVNLSPRTVEGYQHIISHYIVPAIGNTPLTQLKPEQLQHFYTNELNGGLGAQTVRHHHMVIHKALDNAVKWGLVIRNVADSVKPPKAQRIEMQIWNEDELSRFLDTARDSGYYELFYTALYTGMRRSELLALRWQDIDLLLGQVHVSRALQVLKGHNVVIRSPKTASGRRTIALPPSASLLLRDYYNKKKMDAAMMESNVADDDLVFSTFNKPLLPSSVTHAWSKLAVKAGVKHIRFHDARHTHASLLLKQGVHPKIVQERLGHSSIQITLDTYSHVTPGMQEAAANRFDEALTTKYNDKVFGGQMVGKS